MYRFQFTQYSLCNCKPSIAESVSQYKHQAPSGLPLPSIIPHTCTASSLTNYRNGVQCGVSLQHISFYDFRFSMLGVPCHTPSPPPTPPPTPRGPQPKPHPSPRRPRRLLPTQTATPSYISPKKMNSAGECSHPQSQISLGTPLLFTLIVRIAVHVWGMIEGRGSPDGA